MREETVLKTPGVSRTLEMPRTRVRAYIRSKMNGKHLFAYTVVTPAVLFFAVFFYYPFFVNIYYMFTNYNYITDSHFVGLKNILHFFHDPNITTAFSNTFLLTAIGLPLALILALLVAIAVFYMTIGKTLIRSAIFSTSLVSAIVAAIIFKQWFGQELGFIDNTLASLHLARIPWLTQPSWSLFGILLVIIWGTLGYNMVIYLAGLSNVNQELVEAARVDGANAWQCLLFIIIPQLRPTIVFLAITMVINFLKTYVQVAILTNGGPYGSTRTILLYMFQQGFDFQNVGYAAVIAFALFLITLLVTLIQLRVTRLSAD
ncbi:MAG TPA: sugar ABC transporter permease [Ktedonobacterales bacterium]|nr:sugar ABC transporter permease [Ktedonobacterales bacterium]